MKRVALYLRVSTDEQARHGLSLAAQLQDLRKYARKNKYKVVDTYVDRGESARKKPFSRKEFCRLIDDVKNDQIDIILFIKLDRWFRSVPDFYRAQEILDAHHVVWETTQEQYNTTTTNGRLMLNIKLAVAQNESDMTSDRIKFVFSQKLARGEVVSGSVPLGFKIENKHIVKSDKAYIIEDLYNHYMKHQSFGDALRWMTSKYGIAMHLESIKRLLMSELFIGKRGDNENFAERIISNEQFYAVQEIIKRNGNIKRTPSGRIYLFTSLLRCPKCGHKLDSSANSFYGNKKKKYIYYRCPLHYQSHQCDVKKNFSEIQIEKSLLASISSAANKYVLEIKEKPSKPHTANHNNDDIRKKLVKLKELYVNDLISMDEYKKDYERLNNELIPVKEITDKKINPLLQQIQTVGIEDIYTKLDRKQRQSFWHQIIDHISFDDNYEPIIFFK